MNKLYLLLRNNKQTGPFSLAELLAFNLKPADLIWVEGGSGGWNYPFELEELKEHVASPLQPGHAFTVNEPVVPEPMPVAVTSIKTGSLKKIFVSLPASAKKQVAESKPSLEEKAEAIRNKALQYAASENLSDGNTTTKYSRPLSDIKNEYSVWMQEQKSKKKTFHWPASVLYSIGFVGIAAIVFFLLVWMGQSKFEVSSASMAGSTLKKKQKTSVVKEQAVTNEEKTVGINKNILTPALSTTPPVAVINRVATKKQISASVPASRVVVPVANSVVFKTTSNTALNKNKSSVHTPSISDLIQTSSQYIKNSQGIGLAVTVENKSNQFIRMAAIDIIYFDKLKNKMATETVYFSTIKPWASVTRTSSYKPAASASYQIGLVSTEKDGLYVNQ